MGCTDPPMPARPGSTLDWRTRMPSARCASTVQIDPRNPQVIYAALWQAFRKEYTASSGGAGSGLFKSTDGGTTWTEITRNPGLPSGIDGKIGIAVSPANSSRVYALVENAKG